MGVSKKAAILLVLIVFTFCLVGCAKCIRTEQVDAEVTIVSATHRPMWMQRLPSGTYITYSEEWIVTVEYNGSLYTVNDMDAYNKYKDKIGHAVNATMEVKTYDNGKVWYNLLSLN